MRVTFLDRRAGAALRRLGHEQTGGVAIIFALALPVVLGVAGIAVDYSVAAATRTKMQAVADSAAINAARGMQLARTTPESVAAAARAYVKGEMSDATATAVVDDKALTVKVTVEKDIAMTLGKYVWSGNMHVATTATAKLKNSLPLCLLALDDKAPATLSLEKNASLTATGCMVYSDSKNPGGLQAKDNAVMTAALTCTVGGKAKTSGAKLTPDPVTDCPVLEDPLAGHPVPDSSACSYTDKVIKGGIQLLQPGVYCGGLKITQGAEVGLVRGIYIIKDGPLIVDGGATMAGIDVAIYLKGNGSNLTFAAASTIALSAPKDGPLAGFLIFDDPTGASALAIPPYPLPIPIVGALLNDPQKGPPREHKILSDNARTLIGTIYMPQGRLIIDATKPIADRSAYTVLVVRRIDLHDGPNLVLNSDYSASEVPVPKGVGPYGKVMLTN